LSFVIKLNKHLAIEISIDQPLGWMNGVYHIGSLRLGRWSGTRLEGPYLESLKKWLWNFQPCIGQHTSFNEAVTGQANSTYCESCKHPMKALCRETPAQNIKNYRPNISRGLLDQ
jgi:hypothetical protein